MKNKFYVYTSVTLFEIMYTYTMAKKTSDKSAKIVYIEKINRKHRNILHATIYPSLSTNAKLIRIDNTQNE